MTLATLDLLRTTPLLACIAATSLALLACTPETDDDGGGIVDPPFCQGSKRLDDLSLASPGTKVALALGIGDGYVALTSEGALIRFDTDGNESAETIPASGLRDFVELSNGAKIVVGDAGRILRAEFESNDWTTIDSGIDEDLIDVVGASIGGWALAISANHVLYSIDWGTTWTELPAPAGGLRGVFRADGQTWLIADGGLAWTAGDPASGWQAVELGSSEDLIAGSTGCEDCVAIASSTALHVRVGADWSTIPAPTDQVFVAVGDRFVATNAALYSIDGGGTELDQELELSVVLDGIVGDRYESVALGDDGQAYVLVNEPCL